MVFGASGSTPITWSVSAGALPPGMTLDAATGVYSGTPTATGNFTFTITATNSRRRRQPMPTRSRSRRRRSMRMRWWTATASPPSPPALPPGIEAPLALTGVNAGDVIVSIDRRPQNGFLYGLGFNATAGTVQLYSISGTTGFATPIGATGTFVAADGVTPVPVGAGAGTVFGMDFNPTVDRVRVVNSAGQNFRMNPNNGAFVDGNATVANLNMDGAINGATNAVQETAYTNSAPNATLTTQYTLDRGTDALCIQNPPNTGTQSQCQPLSAAWTPCWASTSPPGVNTAAANAPVAAGAATRW